MARIVNQTRATVLAERASIADTWWGRARGLLGRRTLPAGEGLIIRPCNSVHCLFMAFPIDVIYVSDDNQVLRVAPDLKPFRVGPIVLGARAVIELPSGTAAATGTLVGDTLVVTPA